MKTTSKVPVYDAHCPNEPIRAQLRRRMLALNYPAFAQCLCLLLGKIGYEDARPAGRTGWKGRNREGGYDIEASLPGGLGARKVIVQAKQFDALPVFQRSVDELRGTCLRAGAAEALLITTSTFSPVVERHTAEGFTPVAPVRLLDGDALLGLLMLHRIGVWEEAGASLNEPRRLGIDPAFFDSLSRDFAGDSRRAMHSRKGDERCPRWLVTVQVGSPGLFRAGGRVGGKGDE